MSDYILDKFEQVMSDNEIPRSLWWEYIQKRRLLSLFNYCSNLLDSRNEESCSEKRKQIKQFYKKSNPTRKIPESYKPAGVKLSFLMWGVKHSNVTLIYAYVLVYIKIKPLAKRVRNLLR